MGSRGKRRLIAGTKGEVLDLLRRGPRTVDDLASALHLTDNAIRGHLVALERDGLIRQTGLRRTGARRPSYTYRITTEGESLFSHTGLPFLDELLHVLAGTMPSGDLLAAARAAGRRLAKSPPPAGAPLDSRVKAAVTALEYLGGVVEVEKGGDGDGGILIRGFSCPFGSLVQAHGELCVAVESMVAEITREPARQRCQNTAEPAQCLIEITPRAAPRARRHRSRAIP